MAKFFALALLSVCLTVFAAVSAEEDKNCIFKKMLNDSIEACKGQISEENLNLLKENHEASNDEIDCFRACIIKDGKFLKDKKFDIDYIKSKIDELVEDSEKAGVAKSVVETCATQAELAGDECKIAASYTKCFFDAKKAAEKQ